MKYLLLIVTLLLSTPLLAEETSKLSVKGSGLVRKEADLLTLVLSVETFSVEAEKAVKENGIRMEAVRKELLALGLTDKEIRTRNYSLSPQYTHPPKEPDPYFQPSIASYRAKNSLEIRTRQLNKAGAIIDHAAKAGSNSIESISFSLDNEQAAKEEAIVEAIKNASIFAKKASEAAGVHLGEILAITLGSDEIHPVFLNAATRAYAQETPISPKEVEVRYSVSMVYLITPVKK